MKYINTPTGAKKEPNVFKIKDSDRQVGYQLPQPLALITAAENS